MIVTLTKPKFTPRRLTIDITIKEECDLLQRLFGHTVSIPEFMVNNRIITEDQKETTAEIMKDIYNALNTPL